MKNRIFVLLVLVIFLSCFCSGVLSMAASLEEEKQEVEEQKKEAENKLEYVQDELSAVLVKIQELDDDIKKAENEIQSMETELQQLQQKIDTTEVELSQKQEEYDVNKKISDTRLQVMYELGETTYLDILLKSSSIVEFISNYYYLRELMQSDQEMLTKINEEREKIELSKRKLDEEKANLKLLKAKQEQTHIAMQNNRTIQAVYISQLSDEEKALQTKIEEYKAEEQRIQYLMNAAEGLGYDGEFSGGIMAWPIAKSGTYITSDFGMRKHPIQGVYKSHTGIDIGNAGFGAPVIAAADGVVSYAGTLGGYGNCVMINHGSGVSTLYGHGQAILTQVGKEVKKGDLIMEVGSTGVSTGPHLHFEVRINGTSVDPKAYLQ